jgi:hypothetical protein
MKTNPLKSQLHSEAGLPPAFSPLLHERIMSTLHTATIPTHQPATPHYFRRSLIAVAATLLLAATAYLALRQQPSQTPPPNPIVIEQPPTIEPTEPLDLLARATAPAAETLHEARFAYIDHDAKRLMVFLADQLPTNPTAAATHKIPR